VSSEGVNEPVTTLPGKLKNHPWAGAGFVEWLATQPSQKPVTFPTGGVGDGGGVGVGTGAGEGSGVGLGLGLGGVGPVSQEQ